VVNSSDRQKPFNFSACSLPISANPNPSSFVEELRRVPQTERMAIIRTWVQDRSPAAFSEMPYLWEAVREWISARYQLSPREIGLAGSAQVGFSMHPKKALANFERNRSDLDIYAVSKVLYGALEREARNFVARQLAAPKTDFLEQAKTTSRALANRYVDLQQIPAIHDRYPLVARLRNDTSIVIDKLKHSGFCLKPSHIRVYEDWDAMARWTKIQVDSWAESLNAG
jgi:hypothetical protein